MPSLEDYGQRIADQKADPGAFRVTVIRAIVQQAAEEHGAAAANDLHRLHRLDQLDIGPLRP